MEGQGSDHEGQIRENMYNVDKQMFRDSPVNYNSLVKYLKEGREIFFLFFLFIVLFKKIFSELDIQVSGQNRKCSFGGCCGWDLDGSGQLSNKYWRQL